MGQSEASWSCFLSVLSRRFDISVDLLVVSWSLFDSSHISFFNGREFVYDVLDGLHPMHLAILPYLNLVISM